jgi:hypothetical protein
MSTFEWVLVVEVGVIALAAALPIIGRIVGK